MSYTRHQLLYYDNLDDRKELWHLLSHRCMDDACRLRFVNWCIAVCPSAHAANTKAVTKNGQYTPYMAQLDISLLSLQHGLNMEKTLTRLVKVVKDRSK